MDTESVIGFDALYHSMMVCQKGVLWKHSVSRFVLNGLDEIEKLEAQLKNGTYKEKPHVYFEVTYPKRREIMSIHFRDRVYQRSLNDNVLYPEMTKSLIYDNSACQKGKGTDFARNRLKTHLQRFYRKHCLNGYIVQFDIEGYYPNMSHAFVREWFGKKLDDEAFNRAMEILDGFPGDYGYNPGSQIVQIAGISVLDGLLDHYVKEELRIEHYARHMDDFYIIVETYEEAIRYRDMIDKRLSEKGFKLNTEKTKITPLNKRIRFLGSDYKITDTGKIIMNVDPKRVKSWRKKLFRMVEKYKKGEIEKQQIDEFMQSILAYLKHGNNHNVSERLKELYKTLLGVDYMDKIREKKLLEAAMANAVKKPEEEADLESMKEALDFLLMKDEVMD